MDIAVVMTITLKPQVEAQAFETYFRESVQEIQSGTSVSKDVSFALYRPVEARREFVWTTRFPEGELNRVSRGAWPFVVSAMLDMLKAIRQRFAADVSVVSSPVLTAQGLMDQWNEQHGRFAKLSLEPER
jgi:hypothetical protein